MKCPKCKYVSFEYLENCKKCGVDLTEHKSAYGINLPFYASLGIPAFVAKNSTTAEGSTDIGGDVAVAETSSVPDIAGEAFEEVASSQFDADGVPLVDDENNDAVAIAKEVGDVDIDISDEGGLDESQEEISLVEEEEVKEISFEGLGGESAEISATKPETDDTVEFSLDEIGGSEIDIEEKSLSINPPDDVLEETENDNEIDISLDGIEISISDSEVEKEEPNESSQPIYEDTSSIVLDEDALDSITGIIDEEGKKKDKKADKDIDGDDSLVVNLDDLDLD